MYKHAFMENNISLPRHNFRTVGDLKIFQGNIYWLLWNIKDRS